MDIHKTEPVATAGLAASASGAVVYTYLEDILLEIGASPRLAHAMAGVALIAAPAIASWWARRRCMPAQKANEMIDTALSLNKDSNRDDLRRAIERRKGASYANTNRR